MLILLLSLIGCGKTIDEETDKEMQTTTTPHTEEHHTNHHEDSHHN